MKHTTNSHTILFVGYTILITLDISIFGCMCALVSLPSFSLSKLNIIIIIVLLGIHIILVLVSAMLNRNIKESQIETKRDRYFRDLRDKIVISDTSNNEIVDNSIKQNRDIIELMIANMKEINEYYVLSKKMTRQSFVLAVCMCIGGFLIISTAVAFILVNNLDAKEAIIPVISGAVIEAIAATTLIVYKKSLEQLNRYYDALHNNEIFLSSVNLVSKISTERRDQMYEYIIKTKLEDKPKQNNTEGQ